MEIPCPICSKPFDLADKRPKVISCGHSVCLTCMRLHPKKNCPIPGCKKIYKGSTDGLPDNASLYRHLQIEFAIGQEQKPKVSVAQERKPSTVEAVVQTDSLPDVVAVPKEPTVDVKVQPAREFWCLQCERHASLDCIDRYLHNVVNWMGVRAARCQEVRGQLDALSAAESSLASLQEALDVAGREAAPELEAWRGRLEAERAALVEARRRLEAALAGGAAAWEQAKQASPEYALCQEASALLAHLSAPSTSCTLRLQVGDSEAWSASLALQGDPLARHLLCTSLLKGCLQREAREAREERLQREQQECLEKEQKRLQLELEEQERLQRERLQREREERDREVKKREELLAMEELEYAASAVQWEEQTNEAETLGREEAGLRIREGCKVFLGNSWRSGDVVQLRDGRAVVRWGRKDRSEHCVADRSLRMKPGLAMHSQNIKRLRGTPQFDLAEASRGDDIFYKTRLLVTKSFEQMRSLIRLRCDVSAAWTERVLEQAGPSAEMLVVAAPSQRHLEQMKSMPLLQRLYITTKTEDDMSLPLQLEELYFKEVTPKVLAQVPQMPRLRRLEVHSTFADALPVMTFPRVDAGLQWLRLGVHPLATGMALVRAHAASLEELELVAASDAPYGCPSLAHELRRCKLKRLKRMVLLRESRDAFCRHEAAACRLQKVAIWNALMETGSLPAVLCSVCDDLQAPIVID